MSSSLPPPITANTAINQYSNAAQSNFVVDNYVTETGDVIPKKTVTFMHLMIYLGLETLKQSRSAFQTQFTKAQEKVNIMKELNEITQLINSGKAALPSNDKQKSDDMTGYGFASDCVTLWNSIADFNKKYPNSKIGVEKDYFVWNDGDYGEGVDANGHYIQGTAGCFDIYRKGIEALSSNAQTVSSTLSSENEQQSMRTNQAMNRSSGFLQQLQTMMQSAKDALQAAAKSGTM
jgi:hypothetical protein